MWKSTSAGLVEACSAVEQITDSYGISWYLECILDRPAKIETFLCFVLLFHVFFLSFLFSALLAVEDVLDDVPDGHHRCFMKQYLKDWPYPRLNKYRAGQSFNVELNGTQQKCEVQAVDCSLIQVVFQVRVYAFLFILLLFSSVHLVLFPCDLYH